MSSTYLRLSLLALCLWGVLLPGCGGSASTEPEAAQWVYALLENNSDPVAWVGGGPGSFDPGTAVTARNQRTRSTAIEVAGADGSVAIEIAALPGDPLTLEGRLDHVDVSWLAYTRLMEDLLDKDLIVTGAAPNRMELDGDRLWVVNALDNSVTSYDLSADPPVAGPVVILDQSASPADVCFFQGKGYLVTNGSNELIRFDASDGSIEDSIDVSAPEVMFPDPYEIEVASGRLFMARSNIREFGPGASYAPGEIWVFSLPEMEFVASILTGFENPKFLRSVPGEDRIICSCAGGIDFTEQFEPFPVTDAGLVVVNTNTLEISGSINLGLSGAGDMALDAEGETVWIGNSLGGYLIKVDLVSGSVLRSVEDPIELTSEFTYIPSLARVDGCLFAPSFNTDELIVLDAGTDAPVKPPFDTPLILDDNPDLFVGVADLVWHNGSLYMLNGVANSVSRLNLGWLE
jgi:hypothetical protein